MLWPEYHKTPATALDCLGILVLKHQNKLIKRPLRLLTGFRHPDQSLLGLRLRRLWQCVEYIVGFVHLTDL